MARQPSNVPNTVGVPGGAPTSLLAVAAYLTQLSTALNAWVSQAANAINAPLGGTLILNYLPIKDPHVPGQIWNNSGVLTVSAG